MSGFLCIINWTIWRKFRNEHSVALIIGLGIAAPVINIYINTKACSPVYMGLCVFSLPISIMMTDDDFVLLSSSNRKYEPLSIV